jgi:hypothetical protein|nr:MAG TPA: hypothetical protein [Bacteriophage sp.]DAL10191.1 MAG TPA_asm: hypothetical protein [Caudoviricetes sp.]DAU04747.1 MAG TPA: hypothetical protein [Caudoviricetes sp.]
MIYGLICAVVVLSVSLAAVMYDNLRKDKMIERLISDKCGLPPERRGKTGVISPYRKKPRDGGGST